MNSLSTQTASQPTVESVTAVMPKNSVEVGAGMDPLQLLKRGEHYAVTDIHARGGMGMVLRARDANIRRTVAMKVILPEKQRSEKNMLRFIEEAQVTGQLEHPGIVPIYELGVNAQGQVFYTMKLVKGATLKEVLAGLAKREEEAVRRYPLSQLLTIFQKVCDALAFAHAKGVVHRDLKPDNIMVGEFGETLVLDWGTGQGPPRADGRAGKQGRFREVGAGHGQRLPLDNGRHRARNALVHGPRAGSGRARQDRRPHGHLRAGNDPLPAACAAAADRGQLGR